MNDNPSIKINDSRLFNADGSTRTEAPEAKSRSQVPPPKNEDPAPAYTPSSSPIDFPTFILSLATSVQVSLGMIANPMTGKTETDLVHAKQTIDIIGMLEQKTTGNLSPEESGLLKQILFQLRMNFVDVSKRSSL